MEYFKTYVIGILMLSVAVQSIKLQNFLQSGQNEINEKTKSSFIQRQPKFLFRTTSTTTVVAVVSTSTSCYTYPVNGVTGFCAGRKKRQIKYFEEIINRKSSQPEILIEPTKKQKSNLQTTQVESSSEEDFEIDERQPRFFFFFTTTYSTVTITSFATTTTLSFSISGCVPVSFPFSKCVAAGK